MATSAGYLNPRLFGMLYGKLMDLPPVICRVKTNRKVLIPLPETDEEREKELERERERDEAAGVKNKKKKKREGRFLEGTLYFPRNLAGVEGVDVEDEFAKTPRTGGEPAKDEGEDVNKKEEEKESENKEQEKEVDKEQGEEKEEEEEKKKEKDKDKEKEKEKEKEEEEEEENENEKEEEGEKEKETETEEKEKKKEKEREKEEEKDKEGDKGKEKEEENEQEKPLMGGKKREGDEKKGGLGGLGAAFSASFGFAKIRQEYPTIIIRTPYGRGMMDFIGQRFCERGYIVLIQDCRGTGESDGEFDPGLNETRDGKTTLRWVRSQPWFQQCPKIGTWGPSYLGMVQMAVIDHSDDPKEAPPDAMVPIMTSSNFRNVMAPINGGLHFSLFCRWHYITHNQLKRKLKGDKESMFKEAMVFKRMDAKCNKAFNCPLEEVDRAITDQETYLGTTLLKMCFSKDVEVQKEFWEKRNYGDLLRKNKKMPQILLIGGWYDIFLDDQIDDYLYMSSVHPENIRLLVGGWHHFDLSGLTWGMSEGLAHFEATLKDKKKNDKKKVRIFVMGREKWVEMDHFPPPQEENPSISYFLNVEGEKAMLTSSSPSSPASSSKYVYNPEDPTPSIGGREFHPQEAGQRVNNSLEKRSDILVFTTPTLKNRVDVVGHIKVILFIKFSAPSVDVFVRLCVVGGTVGRSKNFADGYTRLFQQEGEEERVKKVDLFLSPCACSFQKGEKIRIQIASGAHPRFHRNNGTGEPFCNEFQKCNVELFHDESHPSILILNHYEE